MAWPWLIVRLYVGYQWLVYGWDKVTNSIWVGEKAGTAVSGFIKFSLTKASEKNPDINSWYAWFLKTLVQPFPEFWSYLVSYGELLVGIGLILGGFVGIAAFFGAFMNINFLLAGAISTNPTLLVLSLGLMLSWRISGLIGLDNYLLPGLGMPGAPGKWIKKNK